jgi:hypothetical protein
VRAGPHTVAPTRVLIAGATLASDVVGATDRVSAPAEHGLERPDSPFVYRTS